MSWAVQNLLRTRETIRIKHDIESDEYNDLLILERQIKVLHAAGMLTDFDVFLLDSIGDGRPLVELERILNLNRLTVSKLFVQLCSRIAYYLGGTFTDDGLIEDMTKKYSLKDEEIETLKKYISGRYRHKLKRK
jgi:hypothetical protein